MRKANGSGNGVRLRGTVKWFNNAKGYGFLGRADGGEDVFCHYSSIQSDGYKSLSEGDEVEFEVETGRGGKQQASRVVRTAEAAGAR